MTMEIEIDKAASGMILAQDVANNTGMTLAPAGLTLTESLIEKLRARGIVNVVVQDNAPSTEDLTQRIAYLFRHSEGDPIRTALRKAVEKYRGIEDST